MKRKRFFIIVFLVLMIFSVFSMTVSAAEETYFCNICQKNHIGEFKNFFGKYAWQMNDIVYGGNIFDNTTNEILKMDMTTLYDENGEEIDDGTTFNQNLSNAFHDLWKGLEVPYQAIALTGKILLVIYVLVQSLQRTSVKNITPEELMKIVIKSAIGLIVIDNGYYILTILIELGSGMFNSVYVGNITIVDNSAKCIFYKALKFQFNEAFVSMIGNILPWFIMQVAKIVVFVAAWSRILEISLRTMFAPIGMADIMTEGLHGNGMRYFRKFFACVIQGSIILASTKVYSVACSTMHFDGFMIHSALACVLIVIMFRSKEFAEQIAGV